MDVVAVGAGWLHALGMVIVVGYYGILGRFVLPVLRRTLEGEALGRTVVAIERRALPFVLFSVVLFTVTGAYLLVNDQRYEGLGNMLASTWTTLMTVKHVLVIGMVVLGVAVDRLAVAVGEAPTEESRAFDLGILGLAAEGATAVGALILLLTAAAHVS